MCFFSILSISCSIIQFMVSSMRVRASCTWLSWGHGWDACQYLSLPFPFSWLHQDLWYGILSFFTYLSWFEKKKLLTVMFLCSVITTPCYRKMLYVRVSYLMLVLIQKEQISIYKTIVTLSSNLWLFNGCLDTHTHTMDV